MSRKSNINPDHYKTAGRGRQGQDVVHEVERQKFQEETARSNRQAKKRTAAKKKKPATKKKPSKRK